MSALPKEGFVREKALIGDKKKGIPGILSFGHTTLWTKTKAGKFPKPVKLGPNITAWRVEDIREYIDSAMEGAA
ncbi:MAG: AlpA family phage regulatory protein [Sedimenticola sp.]